MGHGPSWTLNGHMWTLNPKPRGARSDVAAVLKDQGLFEASSWVATESFCGLRWLSLRDAAINFGIQRILEPP